MSTPVHSSFRPQVEGLGDRIAPSSIAEYGTPTASSGFVGIASTSASGLEFAGGKHAPAALFFPPVNAAPVIVDFTAESVGSGRYIFSGKVIDEAPGGLTVTFGGGVQTTYGMTVTTASDGTFLLSIVLQTNGNDTGSVTASTVDIWGLASNVPSVYVSP